MAFDVNMIILYHNYMYDSSVLRPGPVDRVKGRSFARQGGPSECQESNRSALNRSLEAGFLAIDNDAAERGPSPVTVGRKDWSFFSVTAEAGRARSCSP